MSSDDVLGDYLKEENAELWKERYEFLASLVLTVLRSVDVVKPWDEVAINAVYEYESHRQMYLDSDFGGILSKGEKGDWWVKRQHISSSKGRKRIRILLEQQGWYIATITGQGISVTNDPRQIKSDFTHAYNMVKGRSKNLSKTALRMNKSVSTDLPIIVTQARLADGIVDD